MRILLCLLLSFSLHANVTQQQAIQVYLKLTHANGFLYPPVLRIQNSKIENASSQGRYIIITTGMLKFIKNKHELARVLAHELGHHYGNHIWSSIDNEYNADKLAMLYMTRAGYDRCIGAKLFLRRNSPLYKHHPADRDRWRKFRC